MISVGKKVGYNFLFCFQHLLKFQKVKNSALSLLRNVHRKPADLDNDDRCDLPENEKQCPLLRCVCVCVCIYIYIYIYTLFYTLGVE